MYLFAVPSQDRSISGPFLHRTGEAGAKAVISDRDLDRLIAATHRAALDPRDWAGVVSAIEGLVGQNPVTIHAIDARTRQAGLTWAGQFDPDFVGSYLDHFHNLNPWREILPAMQPGRAQTAAPHLPDGFLSSEYYNDWIRPQQDLRGGAFVRTRPVGERSLIFGVNMRWHDLDRHEDPAMRILAALEPHLSHAFAVNEAMARLASRPQFALQPEAGGVLILDERGYLKWADEGAQLLFGGMIAVSARGRVRLRAAGAQVWLDAALAGVGRGAADLPRPSALSYALRAPDGTRWTLRLMSRSERATAEQAFASPSFAGTCFAPGSGRDVVLVLAQDALPGAHLPATDAAAKSAAVPTAQSASDDLRQRFGLSASETAIARLLAEGLGTAEIAARRQVTRNTVRNQIQSVLTKMGVGSRIDAVRILLQRGG